MSVYQNDHGLYMAFIASVGRRAATTDVDRLGTRARRRDAILGAATGEVG
jgi:hypothetical protein